MLNSKHVVQFRLSRLFMWFVSLLCVLAIELVPQTADAYRIVVRYDNTGQNPNLSTFAAVRVIQSVMREYEAVSAGQIVLEWGGVSTSRTLGTGNIAIFWDSTLGGCVC